MARKRFGRNQKRKLRAEVKQWKDAYDRDRHDAKEAKYKFARIKESIERISRHSALLDPKEIPVDRKHECWRIEKVLEPLSVYMEESLPPSACEYEVTNLTLCHIEAAIRESGLHVMLRYGDMKIGYACGWMMTNEVLNHPENHVDEIAFLIAQEIKRLKESRGRENNGQ